MSRSSSRSTSEGRGLRLSRLFLADEHSNRPGSAVARSVNLLLVVVATAAFFTFAFLQLNYRFNWASVYAYRRSFLTGFGMTLLLSAFALLASLTLGLVVGIGSKSSLLAVRWPASSRAPIPNGGSGRRRLD